MLYRFDAFSSSLWIFFFNSWLSCMACLLSPPIVDASARLTCPPGSTHLWHKMYQIFCQCNLYWDFVVLFCTCGIYWMYVRPGRGIPPLWLFLSKCFFTLVEGLRTKAVLHCTDCKTHWGEVIVILGFVNKMYIFILIWFEAISLWPNFFPPVSRMKKDTSLGPPGFRRICRFPLNKRLQQVITQAWGRWSEITCIPWPPCYRAVWASVRAFN